MASRNSVSRPELVLRVVQGAVHIGYASAGTVHGLHRRCDIPAKRSVNISWPVHLRARGGNLAAPDGQHGLALSRPSAEGGSRLRSFGWLAVLRGTAT